MIASLLGFSFFILIIFLFGLLLSFASSFFAIKEDSLVDKVNSILPQTQCGQCNYPGCKPYAKAILDGEAPINKCVPGGQETIKKIAELLNITEIPNDSSKAEPKEMVAKIIEKDCIGCTLCLKACPVDAILGSAKKMHTVIINDCTGCELCIDPCPIDCIIMIEAPKNQSEWVIPLDKIKTISKGDK